MQLLEILDPSRGRPTTVWPFLVELQRGHGSARQHVSDLVQQPIVPLLRRDGMFGEVIVGRSPEAHVRVRSASISLAHAVFRPFPDGTWQILDRSSTNGTFVNGVRLVPGVAITLSEGDVIRLGSKKYAFGARRLQRLLRDLMGARRRAS